MKTSPASKSLALSASAASFVPSGTANSGGARGGGGGGGGDASPSHTGNSTNRGRSSSVGSRSTFTNTSTSAAIDHFSEYMYNEEMYEVTNDEVMDALEDEMDRDEQILVEMDGGLVGGGGTTTSQQGTAAMSTPSSSTLPAHLAGAAKEFWFPECRDCGCCRGYKHGCICGGLCKCCTSGAVVPQQAGDAATTKARASAGGEVAATKSATANITRTAVTVPRPPLCQYYQRGNCRYGNKCRFSHA